MRLRATRVSLTAGGKKTSTPSLMLWPSVVDVSYKKNKKQSRSCRLFCSPSYMLCQPVRACVCAVRGVYIRCWGVLILFKSSSSSFSLCQRAHTHTHTHRYQRGKLLYTLGGSNSIVVVVLRLPLMLGLILDVLDRGGSIYNALRTDVPSFLFYFAISLFHGRSIFFRET